jgi:hypothetical protein
MRARDQGWLCILKGVENFRKEHVYSFSMSIQLALVTLSQQELFQKSETIVGSKVNGRARHEGAHLQSQLPVIWEAEVGSQFKG